MDELKNELKSALDNGFVPQEIKDFMNSNGHEGQVWLVEKEEEPDRVGIGYKIANADGGEESHVVWYGEDEVQELLKEYNGGQNS